MPERPSKRLFPNPAYVVLLVASTAFVVTALAYLVCPYVAQREGAGPGSLALAEWVDRRSPVALAVEFAVMLTSAGLAVWFDRPDRPPSWRKGPWA